MKFQKVNGHQNHHLFRPYDRNGKLRDIFWVRLYKEGKGRLEQSLKTDMLGDARIERDKVIAEFLGSKPRFAGRRTLVEDKFSEFLKLKEAKSAGTLANNEAAWRNHFKDRFGHLTLDAMDESAWTMYVIEVRLTEPARRFDTHRQIMQNFLNWVFNTGFIKRKPKLEDLDPERNAGKVYLPEEMKKLLEHAANPIFRWVKVQILMGCEMMMRHGEIWTLEWSQIDLKLRLIHLPAFKTKIRKARTFAISEAVYEALVALKSTSTSSWVFPSPTDDSRPAGRNVCNRLWIRVKKASGVVGRFHDLRHTGLTHAFKNAVNPALICDFAGLSLEVAQKTYLHFTVEDTRQVAALYRAAV